MKKRISVILGIFLFILITLNVTSNAGYASNDPTVNSGETITITVTSSENLQNFDLKLENYSGLTYLGCSNSSDAAIVNINTGAISYATAGTGTKTLGTYTFKAPEVSQKSTYKVTFSVNDTTNTSTVTVNPKVTENPPSESNQGGQTSTPTTPTVTEKSNVATLANLGITPNDFSGFKANTFSYNIEVPNDVEKIEVYAKKGQSGQTISGTGTKTLNVGTNKFEISVTAEDGTTKKTYTINVTRKEKEEQEETPEEEPMEEVFGLSELKIEGLELNPQFQTDIYEYKIDLNDDLEKLNVTTLATEANSNIEILGNEELKEGENVITILVKGENEEKTATYQIIVNKTMPIIENIKNMEQDHQQMIKKIIVVSAAGGVILIIIIASIIVKIKKSKGSSSGYIQYENMLDNYEENEIEEQNDDNYDDEFFEEETKKKKRSKGKRFK